MTRVLLSGNEAVAQGAWEAGAEVGVGYPGTPSTQALEHFATLPDVYAEWAPNEKVALEVAIGVSLAGGRSFTTMKHVGLNVAADPLFTLAYTGVNGGLVIFVADDPGIHSSQNEQDSRNYAAFAHIPMLEPADPSEAHEMGAYAFGLSERFDTPVLIRSTVRLSHAKSMVATGRCRDVRERPPYKKDIGKWVMMPGMARARRVELDARIACLAEYAEDSPLNQVELRDFGLGVVCAGVSYLHAREALPDASTFKLGMAYPLPAKALKAFAEKAERLIVIEEADDFLARSLRSLGILIEAVEAPRAGELSPGLIRQALGIGAPTLRDAPSIALPPRPPLLCPGCPHRPVFAALRKTRAVVTGDIGCYTLGTLAPLSAMDACIDMGASVGMAHGIALAGGVGKQPVVAVIGDSTFAHSGITGLVNSVYNSGSAETIVILDNRITAMTGHQGNPVNGITLQERESCELGLEQLAKAVGVGRVRVVDSQDIPAVEAALKEEIAAPELSVIVFKAPCALLLREKRGPYAVDAEQCAGCNICVRLGCPAIGRDEGSGRAYIDESVCVGCGQCEQVCRFSAIVLPSAAPSSATSYTTGGAQ
ncbi:MAG: thiamine pyrophosphate-dependent enzyme [Coriobacteriia bacterium]|nr:thiamine pyrophosphate-dependent enzyme [Coriobacteriia bacterium]